MSLWHKEMRDVTFDDIDAFCRAGNREGMRLDYKAEVPRDLAKLIAAFANTRGGLILIGVEADTTNNQPIWPPDSVPIRGMPTRAGLEEQIIQIATEAIYPPVRVEVSPVIENAHLAGHPLLVVRVEESREAPHAVDQGRKILERVGSTNERYNFAHVDRVEALLKRRSMVEQDRDRAFGEVQTRMSEVMRNSPTPLAWVFLSPVYPWRQLCSPSICFDVANGWAVVANGPFGNRLRYSAAQRIQSGALNVTHWHFINSWRPVESVTILSNGIGAICRPIVGIKDEHAHFGLFDREVNERTVWFRELWNRIDEVARKLLGFYSSPSVETPGLLMLSLRIENIYGWRVLVSSNSEGTEFPDHGYSYNHYFRSSEVEAGEWARSVRDDLAFAFNLDPRSLEGNPR